MSKHRIVIEVDINEAAQAEGDADSKMYVTPITNWTWSDLTDAYFDDILNDVEIVEVLT